MQVGYMSGPLTAIWDIYNTGQLTKAAVAPV